MANRHLARTIVLQALFEWDFNGQHKKAEDVLKFTQKEFAPEFDDQGFALHLLKDVVAKHKELDKLIAKFAPEWPLDQITLVDRNVLRIGIYELKFDQDIPPKVAINEAIELAKAFGGDASGKFVNGVLGSIYKEMISQGEKQTLVSQGIKEVSAGGVIYRQEDDGYYFVLLLDAYGKWTFPKGGIKEGESLEVAVARELFEETGLKNLVVKDFLGETQVKVHKPEEKPYRKLIKYFLVETRDKDIVVPKVSELLDVKWFPKHEVLNTISYDNAKDIFNMALQKLNIS